MYWVAVAELLRYSCFLAAPMNTIISTADQPEAACDQTEEFYNIHDQSDPMNAIVNTLWPPIHMYA